MVIVRLQGGLGNQMFQYALARHLSIKNKTALYLDLSDLSDKSSSNSNTPRHFELNIFNVKYSPGLPFKLPGILKKLHDHLFPIKEIRETDFLYNKAILAEKGNIYLDGYWQNEQYFKDIEATIRAEFTLKTKPDEQNRMLAEQIKATSSVSVHFRRGDYITNAVTNSFHGVCSKEYYVKAIAYINEKIPAPHFYIFSDDINWVKQNFDFKESHTYININKGEKGFEDMRLMSHCKHNIIANSSFSWWAAWLNTNKDKVVISPLQWLVTKKTDIVPAEWIKL